MKPLFSVVIANHNNDKYIEQAITSVINQTFEKWELIIVDDASTDHSVDIINEFVKHDKRIKLIQNSRREGVGKSRNIGAQHISSEFFGDLDGDDALTPEAIEVMYNEHINNPEYSMIYSQFQKCDKDMNPLYLGYCAAIPTGKTNLEANVVSHFRTYKLNYFNQTAGFHEILPKAIDKDISFKMEEVGKLKFVNKILYFYRDNQEGISQHANKLSAEECFTKVKREAYKRRNIKLSILLATDKYFSRRAYLEFTETRYKKMFPDAEICIGVDDADEHDFCKSRAINNAAANSHGDVFLIIDTDIIVSKRQILDAIAKLSSHALVTTHDIYHRLKKEMSNKILKDESFIDQITAKDIELSFNFNSRIGRFRYLNGGVQVITRDNFYKAGGYDESFVGWGGEDTAFNAAVVLQCGSFYKLRADAYHLWHPRQKGYTNYKTNKKNLNFTLSHIYINAAEKENIQILNNYQNRFKVHYYANELHYEQHSVKVWESLPKMYKGQKYENISDIPLDHYLLIAGKVEQFKQKNLILINHGAGQSYIPHNNSSYAGGSDRNNVKLFIQPNDYAAKLDKKKYSNSIQAVVGCPKLDKWHQRKLEGKIKKRGITPIIAISFHWECKVCPETRSAWDYYKCMLPMLANKNFAKEWKILGHGHPRILDELAFHYEQNGIEVVKNFDEVMERADLYICDHMSTLYEFASTDRPVIVLNAPWYRKEVEHGLRFWEFADVGINVNEPKELETAIYQALEDPLEQKMKRERAVAAVYKYRDGMATERAVKAITDFLNQTDYAGGSVSENVNITPEKKRILNSEGMYRRWFGTQGKRR